MGEPPVTIAIPVFATPPELLSACLYSIAASRSDSDEVLMVIDGPQEPELERVIARATALDVRVVRQPRRLGLVANWNACLQLASRDLVHVMHADDAVAPEFHMVSRRVMKDCGVAVVAAGRVPAQDPRLSTAKESGSGLRVSVLRGAKAVRYLLSSDKPATGSFVLRRSALGVPMVGFDSRFPYCPDEELFLRVAAAGGIGIVEADLYFESRHDGQARFGTWRQPDFADIYYEARTEGTGAFDRRLAPLARRETSRRLLSVGRQLCTTGDTRSARTTARSIADHDRASLLEWRYWALLILSAIPHNLSQRSAQPAASHATDPERDT